MTPSQKSLEAACVMARKIYPAHPTMQDIALAIDAAVEQEREECAKVADEKFDGYSKYHNNAWMVGDVAAAIRQRSVK